MCILYVFILFYSLVLLLFVFHPDQWQVFFHVFPVTAWFWHETLSWHRGMVSLLGSSRCPACWETAMGGAPLLSRSSAKGSRACVHHAVRRISMPNYDCFWISWIIGISGCFWIRDSHICSVLPTAPHVSTTQECLGCLGLIGIYWHHLASWYSLGPRTGTLGVCCWWMWSWVFWQVGHCRLHRSSQHHHESCLFI